ncbi:hypothetical protein AtNW77_Chr3g0178131 [Arabidopsis thaliana]
MLVNVSDETQRETNREGYVSQSVAYRQEQDWWSLISTVRRSLH